MNDFSYYNPVKVIFGEGVVEQIGDVSSRYGKCALVASYDDVSYYGELLEKLHGALDRAGISYTDFFKIQANPTIAQAKEGIEICKEKGIDVIIAVGGGSVMDCAKVIAAGVYYPYDDIRKMISFSHSDGSSIPPEKALPTIMIPTLPATGSEMNPTAVITDEETVSKSYVWAPNCLYPKVALVDPKLSVTLPPYQTACAGLDTIAHTLESYFNGDSTVNLDLQDRLQEGLIRTVLDNLPKIMKKPNDIQIRGVLQWASAIALNGWILSGTYGWAPMHQMGHVLGARYHATHGATLATMILAWMKYFNKREDGERYIQFAKEVFGCDLESAIVKFESLIAEVGVQTRISQFGVKVEDIDTLVEDVVRISFGADGMLGSVPALTQEDVREIYKLALE